MVPSLGFHSFKGIRGKYYKTVVRPAAMMYGSECWALSKIDEIKTEVAKMRTTSLECVVWPDCGIGLGMSDIN